MFVNIAIPALEFKQEGLNLEQKEECFFCLIRTRAGRDITETIEQVRQRTNACMQKHQMKRFELIAKDFKIQGPKPTTEAQDSNSELDSKLDEIIRLSKASNTQKTTNIKSSRAERKARRGYM